MHRLVTVHQKEDIFPEYRDTPIGRLLEYHNLQRPFDEYSGAQLLIGKCMDNRKRLRLPDNFAYIIRTGGANLRYTEFNVSFAIGVGGVQAIALISHTNCGMSNVMAKKDEFIRGLVERAGWDAERAEEHFMNYAPMFEVDNAIDFVVNEAQRLRLRYPKILIVPMVFRIEDQYLRLIRE